MDLNKYTKDNKFKKCIYEKEKYVRVTNTFLNSRLKNIYIIRITNIER